MNAHKLDRERKILQSLTFQEFSTAQRSTWGLSSLTRGGTVSPVVEERSLYHWTTGEVLQSLICGIKRKKVELIETERRKEGSRHWW